MTKQKFNINWNGKRTSIYFTELESELFLAQHNLKSSDEIKEQIQKICDNKKVIVDEFQSSSNLSEFIKTKMFLTAARNAREIYNLKNPTLL